MSRKYKFQFWQQNNQPIELDSNSLTEQKLDYIHEKPVKHGFVNSAECFDWSSAVDYAGGKSFIHVELLD